MASQPSQRPRRNASPASSSKLQPMRATLPFSLISPSNPSSTRGNGLRRPSPSSSPVHGSENALKHRRSSPETRGSPEHRRSPSSPSLSSSKGERGKLSKSSSGSIRRTPSIDAISPYMSGQWPKDVGSYGPSVCHKSTQTPVWEEGDIEDNSGTRNKRSNSLGSGDQKIKEKLKQHLQRTKQGSKSSHTYGRQSPLHGDHTAIPASRLPQSIPISIPLGPRPSEGPQKRSLEGLNSEIQKLVLTDASTERTSEHVPDGRKAPVFEVLSGAPFRTVDTHTQTPSNNQEGQDSSGSGSSSSRSHSASPTYPIMPGASDSRPSSRCSSGGAADAEENVSPELPSGGSKYASSPKPNNSYLFAREPPDGAEKVPLHVEDADRSASPQIFCPDKTKVNFITIPARSAFSVFNALPSLPKVAVTSPATANQQLSQVEASQ
ncbi:glucocorticoid-induced transcript 1 protein isoform X1 [Pocillopora verrucosa]|nr:glucocorticoid-induced transcript 1 protein-like [Pocillopora damicornis]XP_027036873.1 glucocorticoid-induced transcript 1 protein-like [Pocillopora damicornis]XP_058964460.1 glucocorticoid-induced transcript 1 protein-like isoform X1 [Pocillopora verrucosa]XP_058964461.1 glucocorticoid-induced transcript 1 protein-like isoform X1 [Pocillopora verrucosa]